MIFFSGLTKGNLIKTSGGRGLAGDTRVFWVPVGCPTLGGDPMGRDLLGVAVVTSMGSDPLE